MSLSYKERVALLEPEQQAAWLESVPLEVLEEIQAGEWWWTAREEQLAPPGDWMIWLVLAGRGFGKTRTGSEWLIDEAMASPVTVDGTPSEWGAFSQTFSDCRNITVEGPSGLLQVLTRRGIPFHYQKMPTRITLKEHGQRIHARGADDPDVGRGLNLAGVWCDEMTKWRYGYDAWTAGIAPSLRSLVTSGRRPRACITTTPKNVPLLLEWLAREDGSVHVTRGSTFDNAANLSPLALEELKRRYEGTRIGRQELYGEVLTDVEGALWTIDQIEATRVRKHPDLDRVVVAIDPAATAHERSDETGIVAAGMAGDQFYVLSDVTGRYSPDRWARAAIGQYEVLGADVIVGEANMGGDMIEAVLRQVDRNIPYRSVHASRGKRVRAEPIAALYEQGRVHHVGVHADLETQMTTWTPDLPESPDRMDALVWALTELAFRRKKGRAQSFRT